MADIFRAVASRSTTNPKTVLAFFGTVIGLLLAAAIGASVALKGSSLQSMVPIIWIVAGSVVVLLVIGLFVVMLLDPTKLMLGRVSGQEYMAMHRTVLGDSVYGEQVAIVSTSTPGVSAPTTALLEPRRSETADGDDENADERGSGS